MDYKALSQYSVPELMETWAVLSGMIGNAEGSLEETAEGIKKSVVAKTVAEVGFTQDAELLTRAMELEDKDVVRTLKGTLWERREAVVTELARRVDPDALLDELFRIFLAKQTEDQVDDELSIILDALGKAGKGHLMDPLIDAVYPDNDRMRFVYYRHAFAATKDERRLPALRAEAERLMALEEKELILLREDYFRELLEVTKDPQDLARARASAAHWKQREARARAWLGIARTTGFPEDLLKAFDEVINALDVVLHPDALLSRCVEKFMYLSTCSFMDYGPGRDEEPWSDEVRADFLARLRALHPEMATGLEESYDEAVATFKK